VSVGTRLGGFSMKSVRIVLVIPAAMQGVTRIGDSDKVMVIRDIRLYY